MKQVSELTNVTGDKEFAKVWISPDGSWIAFTTNESYSEVHVFSLIAKKTYVKDVMSVSSVFP